MTVKIGTVDLNNVLTWREEATTTIPVKKPVRKSTPTHQSQYWTRTPRMIYITARMTGAEKAALYALQNQHLWQTLYDYDGVTLIDYVWIETPAPEWHGDEDKNYPWHITLTLMCSTT